MTEDPYSSLERAIAAAVAEIHSLREQRSTLQARIEQLEKRFAGQIPRGDGASAEPPGDVGVAQPAESAERLHQLESEREAIRSRLLSLQARLGYLGSAEPKEHQNDHR